MDDETLHDLIAAIQWTDSSDYHGGDWAWNGVAAERALIDRIADNGICFALQGKDAPYREALVGLTVDDYLYFTGGRSLLWRVPWELLEQRDVNTLRLLPKGEA